MSLKKEEDFSRVSLADIEAGRAPAASMPFIQEQLRLVGGIVQNRLELLSEQMLRSASGLIATHTQTEAGRELGRSFLGMDISQVSEWLEEHQVTPFVLLGLVSEVSGMKTDELMALNQAIDAKLKHFEAEHQRKSAQMTANRLDSLREEGKLIPTEKKALWKEKAVALYQGDPKKFTWGGKPNISKIAKEVAEECGDYENTVRNYFKKIKLDPRASK